MEYPKDRVKDSVKKDVEKGVFLSELDNVVDKLQKPVAIRGSFRNYADKALKDNFQELQKDYVGNNRESATKQGKEDLIMTPGKYDEMYDENAFLGKFPEKWAGDNGNPKCSVCDTHLCNSVAHKLQGTIADNKALIGLLCKCNHVTIIALD